MRRELLRPRDDGDDCDGTGPKDGAPCKGAIGTSWNSGAWGDTHPALACSGTAGQQEIGVAARSTGLTTVGALVAVGGKVKKVDGRQEDAEDTAAREVDEESHGLLRREDVRTLLAAGEASWLPAARCVGRAAPGRLRALRCQGGQWS